MKFLKLISMAALATFGAKTAQAQTSDSADVEVFAEFFVPSVPVVVNGVAALNFGTVGIPTVTNTQCRYQITEALPGNEHAVFVNGIQDNASTRCNWIDPTTNDATFSISCEPGQGIALTLTNALTTTDPEIFVDTFIFSSSERGVITEGSPACPATGSFELKASGSISVTENALEAVSGSIGQVTLDVSY